MDINRAIRGMVRVGTVASTNTVNNTARVVFDDKDNLTSYELRILHRFSGKNRDYWMPDVGDSVVCLFGANDENTAEGFILGSFFTEKHPPQCHSNDITRIDYADGSFFEFNRATGDLTVQCTGDITINGANIHLN